MNTCLPESLNMDISSLATGDTRTYGALTGPVILTTFPIGLPLLSQTILPILGVMVAFTTIDPLGEKLNTLPSGLKHDLLVRPRKGEYVSISEQPPMEEHNHNIQPHIYWEKYGGGKWR